MPFRRHQRLCPEPSILLRPRWAPNATVLYIKTTRQDRHRNLYRHRRSQEARPRIQLLPHHHLWHRSIPKKPCRGRQFRRALSTIKISAASRTCAARSKLPEAPRRRQPVHRPHRNHLPPPLRLHRPSLCHRHHSPNYQGHATAAYTREVTTARCTVVPCTAAPCQDRCPVQAHPGALPNRTIDLLRYTRSAT